MRGSVLAALVLLSGCAAPGGGRDGTVINSSPGAVNINGPVTIIKQFGMNCPEARSGFGADSQGQSDQGGEVSVDPAARDVQAGYEAGASFIGALAALDICGETEEEQQ